LAVRIEPPDPRLHRSAARRQLLARVDAQRDARAGVLAARRPHRPGVFLGDPAADTVRGGPKHLRPGGLQAGAAVDRPPLRLRLQPVADDVSDRAVDRGDAGVLARHDRTQRTQRTQRECIHLPPGFVSLVSFVLNQRRSPKTKPFYSPGISKISCSMPNVMTT